MTNNRDGVVDEEGQVMLDMVSRWRSRWIWTADVTVSSCTQPVGYLSNSTDCNDNDEDVNPPRPRCNGETTIATGI